MGDGKIKPDIGCDSTPALLNHRRTSTNSAACLWCGRTLLTAVFALASVAVLSSGNALAQTVPEISIEAGTNPVTEGVAVTFTLSRTGPTTATLAVDVSVTETGSVLSVTPSMTVTFDVGDSSATLTVTTDNDAIVEDPSTVTATVAPASDNRYQVVATANEATVTVEDNDTAALTLSVDETVVAEADTGAATLTATITNGVTFAKAQDVTVTLGGSATAGSDFTFTDAAGRTLARPYGLRFRRGASSATGTITAVNDTRDDDAETIVIDASYGGSAVGSQHTITITDDDVPPSGLELEQLAVTASGRDMYPQFDPATLHYAVGCSDQDTVTLMLSTKAEDTRLSVNGTQQSLNQNAEVELTGVGSDSDILIRLSNSDGATTTYVVHCLDEDFPVVTVRKQPRAWDGLILSGIELRSGTPRGTQGYLVVMDNNGVPWYREKVDGRVVHFKVQEDSKYPYSYSKQTVGGTARDTQIVVLDDYLGTVQRVQTVSPLTVTDHHDFAVKKNGNYVLLAYEPAQRDLSEFNDENGDPYATDEAVRDSVIQEATPEGTEVFRWNSWDHMAIEDCRIPGGYSQINSVEDVDGNFLGSFRGCSKVLMIDGTTGEVVWRVGRSNLSDQEWIDRGEIPQLTIIGDPYGDFCGQHSAKIIGNGNLVLFDNGTGGHCLADTLRQPGVFSRVVEYSLDLDRGEAIFQRHHSLHGSFNRLSLVQGLIEVMDNGNWLISWGRGYVDDDPDTPLPPDETITEVNPHTGEEFLSIEFRYQNFLLQARSYSMRYDEFALGRAPVPLAAEFPVSELTSAVHFGPMDSPKVLVAFNQPVVDATVAGSIDVMGAAVASVIPHLEAGAPANAYLVTLTPAGNGPITFGLAADRSCAEGGVCTAAGGGLETVCSQVLGCEAWHIPGPLTVSITSNTAPPANGAFTVTIAFPRAVTGLMAGEIEVTHGTASNLRGAGASYTLDIEPAADFEDDVTVRVPAGAAVDAANYGNAEGLGTFAVDTRVPRVLSITSDTAHPTKDPFTVTITFSEAVAGLTAGKVAVANGAGSNLTGTGARYTLDIAPNANLEADVTVRVPAGAAVDAANNGNVEGLATFRVDTRAPAWLSAAVNGTDLTLSYGEALDTSSRPGTGDFTVNVESVVRSVSGVAVGGRAVTLTLAPAVAEGEAVTVTYQPGTNPIRDPVGNAASGLGNASVANTTAAPNTDPEIRNPGPFELTENQARVTWLRAIDTDPGDEVTGYAIAGGADRARFTIVGDTGELRFGQAPNFEAPSDLPSIDPPSGAGDNEYIVVVRVTSGAGTRERTAEQPIRVRVTDVNEPPAAPAPPIFFGATADSLRVAWIEPDNTGPPITGYDVQYREGGSSSFTDVPHTGTGRTVQLTGLRAGTDYRVRVRARNEEGQSDWSAPGEGRTIVPLTVRMTTDLAPPVEGAFRLQFHFSEAVTGFSGSDIETGQDPACMDTENNPVFCDPGFAAFQTADNSVFTTLVTPKTAGVAGNYTLTITVPAGGVRSSAGNKTNEEATLEVRVAPPGVTVPISSLGLTGSRGNGQVALRWNAPGDTGGAAMVRYEYRAAEGGGEFGAWIRVDAAARSATIPDLTNGREYVFELRGANALGYGGVETVRATPAAGGGGGFGGGGGGSRPTVPGAPANLTAVGGDGQVVLTWEAPARDGGAAITDYEYRINRRNPWISIGSTDTTHTVTGLVNGTEYVFEVRAVNRIGKSFSSNRAEATPEAPEVFTLDFAHFVNGDGVTSDLVFVNAGSVPVRPAIYFYDTEGNSIAAESVVDVTGDLEIAEDGGLTVLTEMEALGELTIPTHGRGELVSGSVKVISNASIGGGLRFDLPDIGEAVVGANPPIGDAIFPVRRREGGINTGVAIHNLEEEPMEVSCRLMSGGAVLEEVSFPLKANGQTSWLIDARFPGVDTSGFVGSVRCDAVGERLFSAVALEMDPGARTFITLPLFPVEPTGTPAQEAALDFAHFVNGDGSTSDLVFVNVGTQPSRPGTPFISGIPPIRPAIYFYDTEGNPIAAESVVDVTADLEVREDGGLTVRTEMEPLEELTISTHGRGALVTGSVKVVSDNPIGGMLRFNLPGIGEAVVEASPHLSDAIFPVRRREGGITTGVAIHNLESSSELVRCELLREGVLRDSVSLPLGPNGQTSWLIDAAFPAADTSDFVGSVRCDALGEGLFSAVALEMDPGARTFITLPVATVPEMPSP